MHDCLEKMARDDAQIIQRLQGEMRILQQRLANPQQSACLDSLTRLANRRGLEAHSASKEQQRLCVMVFIIDRCAAINEKYGWATGDAVLSEFGKRLSNIVRSTDFPGRWGGPEFMILTECSLQDAMTRMRQISQIMSGRYGVVVDGREIRIDVKVASSMAERLAGENLEHLVSRMQAAYNK
jgi:diguanylate cyclase (GGDEF)-like protein